jgi:hypothetical protein
MSVNEVVSLLVVLGLLLLLKRQINRFNLRRRRRIPDRAYFDDRDAQARFRRINGS